MKLKQLLEIYIHQYSSEANLQHSTIINKQGVFRRFLAFLNDKDLTLENVKLYLADMRARSVTPNSIKTEIRNLKAFTSWLYQNNHISENWGKLIPVPKVAAMPEKLVTMEMAEKIIIAGTEAGKDDHKLHRERKTEMRYAMRFMLYTGLRISELKKLKGADIDFYNQEPQFIVHSKGGDVDLMPFPPMPDDLLNEIKRRASQEYIFKVCEGTLNDALKRGAEKLGIKGVRMHLHILRKIFCTSLMKNGATLSMVSRLMRHSEIGITNKIYTQYNVSDLAHTLTSFHPLVRKVVDKEKIFDNILDTLTIMGIDKDERFSYSTKKNGNELIISITSR